MDVKNYYEILGISEKATTEQIKAAFREQAKRWHPDVNSAHNAAEMFRNTFEAYEILSTPSRRQYFDRVLAESRASKQVIAVKPEFAEWIHHANNEASEKARESFDEFIETLSKITKKGPVQSFYTYWTIWGLVCFVFGFINPAIGAICGIIAVFVFRTIIRKHEG